MLIAINIEADVSTDRGVSGVGRLAANRPDSGRRKRLEELWIG
jgi:hypothetical protein